MIWMFGPDAKCRSVSKAWLIFRGRTIEQERGDGWLEGVHTEDRERCVRSFRNAFLVRQVFQTEFRVRRADGSYAWVLCHGVPQFLNDGSFLGYSGELQEVSVPISGSLIEGQRAENSSSLRRLLHQIGTQSRSRLASNTRARQFARLKTHPIPASALLHCLDACTTPVLVLDRHGNTVFVNSAGQLFAAKNAGLQTTAYHDRRHQHSGTPDEKHPTAGNSELPGAKAVDTWLDSEYVMDPQQLRITTESLGDGLTVYSFIEASTKPPASVADRSFLHDVLNVATGMQLLIDLLAEGTNSASEEAEYVSLLRLNLNQLFVEIETERGLLESAET